MPIEYEANAGPGEPKRIRRIAAASKSRLHGVPFRLPSVFDSSSSRFVIPAISPSAEMELLGERCGAI